MTCIFVHIREPKFGSVTRPKRRLPSSAATGPPLLVATRYKMTKQTAAQRISVRENYMKLHLMGFSEAL